MPIYRKLLIRLIVELNLKYSARIINLKRNKRRKNKSFT
jgi:hypothetical protein